MTGPLTRTPRLLGPLLALLAAAAPGARADGPADAGVDGATLDVMAWNVALLPTGLVANGQWSRAAVIPLAARGHDVLVLSEAFDDDVRAYLVGRLRRDYPYATEVVGDDGFLRQDGGVLVLSRWPIVRQAQVVYAERAGNDAFADKGAAYACVEKGGRRWHVFGTHLQSGPGDDARRVAVRAAQLAQLRAFAEAQAIPAGEPVLFAGDLNVDLTRDAAGAPSGELAAALAALAAELPPVSGLAATYDCEANGLAEDERVFLDYVLWSRRHARPAAASLEARRARSPVPLWLGRGRVGRELSDHEPVVGVFTLAPAPSPPAPTPSGQVGPGRGLAGALGSPR